MNTIPDHVEQIYEFNRAAGLLEKEYSDFLESSFQIEEALEGFSDLPKLAAQVLVEDSVTGYESYTPKDVSRAIVALARMDGEITEHISDVDRLDKACDAIVFAVGSMAKLGLTPDLIKEALGVVMTANMQKLTMPKDEYGKLRKPDNFEGPEVKLQKILDKRK